MTKGWTKYKLSDLGFLGRGKSKHRPRNDESLFGGKYPFIQTGEIKAANLYISDYEQTYNEKGLAQSKLWNENTLCMTIAANIAETAILKIKACFPDSVVGFVADDKLCNVFFIKYYIDFIKNRMQSVSGGACQDNLSLDKIAYFDIEAPKKEMQDKIAKVLSNYDDLIENNNKRIKILEEMAQKIYKEWFVDFKFPGHEIATFKQTELGKIPLDWEVKQIGKEYKTYLGGTPSRNEEKYWNGNISWLNSGKTNELRIIKASEYITELGLEKSSTKLMPQYTTVLAITGATLGQVSMLGSEMCANQSVVGIYSDTNPEYVFYLMKDKIQKLVQNASGGAQQHINKDIVNEMKFVLPADTILNDFKNSICPINKKIFNLLYKNRALKQTRDLLLPRLISGEIDVKNLKVL